MRANEQIDCNFFLCVWHCRCILFELSVLLFFFVAHEIRKLLEKSCRIARKLPMDNIASFALECTRIVGMRDQSTFMNEICIWQILRSTQMHEKKTNKCVNSPTWTSHSLSVTEHCEKWVNDGKTETKSDFYTVGFSRERLRLSVLSTWIMKLWPSAKWFWICKIYQPHTDIPNKLIGFRWFFVWKIVSEKFVQTFNKLICL